MTGDMIELARGKIFWWITTLVFVIVGNTAVEIGVSIQPSFRLLLMSVWAIFGFILHVNSLMVVLSMFSDF